MENLQTPIRTIGETLGDQPRWKLPPSDAQEFSARVRTGRTLQCQRKPGEHTSPEMIAAVFLALVASVGSTTGPDDPNMSRALKLMAETPLIDG